MNFCKYSNRPYFMQGLFFFFDNSSRVILTLGYVFADLMVGTSLEVEVLQES